MILNLLKVVVFAICLFDFVTNVDRCYGFVSQQVRVGSHKNYIVNNNDNWLRHYADRTDIDDGDDDDDDDDDISKTPSSSFEELGLIPSVLAAVRSQNDWVVPTPVQKMVLPNILEKVDDGARISPSSSSPPDAVWVESPTGSGKTGAFLLPLVQNLLLNSSNNRGGRVRSLILCPTRELAQQISNVVKNLVYNLSTKNTGRGIKVGVNDHASTRPLHQKGPLLSSMVIYGGIPLRDQIEQLSDIAEGKERPLDILIATPGRLMDILTYYDNDDGQTRAEEAVLERKILKALESEDLVDDDGANSKTKKNKKQKGGRGSSGTSLSLEQLERLQLDSILTSIGDSNSGGRQTKKMSSNGENGRLQLKSLLKGLQYFIVDEADRVLGNAFRDEFDGVLDLVVETSQSPKMWLFSATFPKSIEPRLDEVLTKANVQSPLRLQIDHESQGVSDTNNNNQDDEDEISVSLQKKLERSNKIASASRHQQVGDASTIRLRTIRLDRAARTQALKRLLQDYGVGDEKSKCRVLVFVSTRYGTEHVSQKLRRAGIESKELHGKLDQDARLRRLTELSKGKTQVLLCTDVAARGIDIKDIDLVVNYDLPRSTAEFVHRIGRTGRAGRKGTAISFLTADMEAHMDLIESRHIRKAGWIPEREVLAGFEPDEEKWKIEAEGSRLSVPGAVHSAKGLAHDRMVGGIKGRRKSKKDKLREHAAAAALKEQSKTNTKSVAK